VASTSEPFLYDAAYHALELDTNGFSADLRRIGAALWALYRPARVADVGCSIGNVLAGLMAAAVADPTHPPGLVVHAYESPQAIGVFRESPRLPQIPLEAFTAIRMEELTDWHLDPVDLVVCTEVGEHLTPEQGRNLVDNLTCAADRVVWSAALPNVGGIGHINLQPLEYWDAAFEVNHFVLDSQELHNLDAALGIPFGGDVRGRVLRVYRRR